MRPSRESKEEKFRRLAEARVNKNITQMRHTNAKRPVQEQTAPILPQQPAQAVRKSSAMPDYSDVSVF